MAPFLVDLISAYWNSMFRYNWFSVNITKTHKFAFLTKTESYSWISQKCNSIVHIWKITPTLGDISVRSWFLMPSDVGLSRCIYNQCWFHIWCRFDMHALKYCAALLDTVWCLRLLQYSIIWHISFFKWLRYSNKYGKSHRLRSIIIT